MNTERATRRMHVGGPLAMRVIRPHHGRVEIRIRYLGDESRELIRARLEVVGP